MPAVLQLLICVCHAFLIFGLRHAILQFVRVAKHFLLLVAEARELALQFFTLRFIAGALQRRLQIAHLAIEIFLTLREFAEAVENLARLARLRFLLRLGLLGVGGTLGFVTVLLIFEIELLEVVGKPTP